MKAIDLERDEQITLISLFAQVTMKQHLAT